MYKSNFVYLAVLLYHNSLAIIYRPFIEHCRHGVLQYTVIRPITTIIAL